MPDPFYANFETSIHNIVLAIGAEILHIKAALHLSTIKSSCLSFLYFSFNSPLYLSFSIASQISELEDISPHLTVSKKSRSSAEATLTTAGDLMADDMMPKDFMKDGFDEVMGNHFADGDVDELLMDDHRLAATENDNNPKNGNSMELPSNSVSTTGIPHRLADRVPTQDRAPPHPLAQAVATSRWRTLGALV